MHFVLLRSDILKAENSQFENMTLLDQKKAVNDII